MFTPPAPANDLLPFAVERVVVYSAEGVQIRPGTAEDARQLAADIAGDPPP